VGDEEVMEEKKSEDDKPKKIKGGCRMESY
jgi:hypothetical protein